jgi:hypothetical protein
VLYREDCSCHFITPANPLIPVKQEGNTRGQSSGLLLANTLFDRDEAANVPCLCPRFADIWPMPSSAYLL